MASTDMIGNVMGPFSSIWGSIGMIAQFILFGSLFGGIAAGIFYWWFNKKKWNLRVEFKLTRSDGHIVNAEWGKGLFNAKKGFILLKRPGIKRPIEMKPADPKKYIYGDNILTVAQLGPNTWVPVLPESFAQYINEDGEVEYFIDMKTDMTDQLSWAENFAKRAKDVYSILSFLEKFQTPLAIGFVILAQAISTAFIIAVIK